MVEMSATTQNHRSRLHSRPSSALTAGALLCGVLSALVVTPLCVAYPPGVMGGDSCASGGRDAPALLFRSGFEEGVELEPPFHDGGSTWWQRIVGDDGSGFAWPMSIWGAEGMMQVLVDSSLPVDEYLENCLEATVGPGGVTTRALHLIQHQKAEEWTQDPYYIDTGGVETSDLYISYWLRFPDGFAAALGPDGWLTFIEWKTCCEDYRIAAYVYRDLNEDLYWYVHGDNVVGAPPFYEEYWYVENRAVAVPVGEWFQVEVFLHRSTEADGRFWWAVNGEVIVDRLGPTRRAEPIHLWMPFTLYTGADSMDMWVDDIEVWDGFPCGQGQSCFRNEDDLAYLLQPETITVGELAAAGFHWLILEPTRDGSASSDFTPAEVAQIREDGPCEKNALAYLSIGEAEDYRDYWDPNWVDANGEPIPGVAPDWLGPVDPDWPGNYKVRYWHPQWQALMFGTPSGPDKTPLDRIIDQGFDGVYLDIIDGYQYWSDPDFGIPELTRMDARDKMIDFVEAIAVYARETRGAAGFLVFPQNAAEIIRDDDEQFDAETERYFAAVSGIGQEDLYYDELTPQSPAELAYTLDQLREFHARGKTVLVTDYVIDQENPGPGANDARVADFYSLCRGEGFVPHAAHRDRDLDEIVMFSTDNGWSVSQPTPGCVPAIVGDIDDDGDVDIDDFRVFAGCMHGPGVVSLGACADADFTEDADVDVDDFALFQEAFGR